MTANAVVLVIGGYQISIAKYLRGRGGDAKTIISPNTSFCDIMSATPCEVMLLHWSSSYATSAEVADITSCGVALLFWK